MSRVGLQAVIVTVAFEDSEWAEVENGQVSDFSQVPYSSLAKTQGTDLGTNKDKQNLGRSTGERHHGF